MMTDDEADQITAIVKAYLQSQAGGPDFSNEEEDDEIDKEIDDEENDNEEKNKLDGENDEN